MAQITTVIIPFVTRITPMIGIRYMQGLHSPSGKTSYQQILWGLEAARLGVIMIVSLWNLPVIPAALLSSYQSNIRAIWRAYAQILWLRDFTRYCGKTSICLVNRGPDMQSWNLAIIQHGCIWLILKTSNMYIRITNILFITNLIIPWMIYNSTSDCFVKQGPQIAQTWAHLWLRIWESRFYISMCMNTCPPSQATQTHCIQL